MNLPPTYRRADFDLLLAHREFILGEGPWETGPQVGFEPAYRPEVHAFMGAIQSCAFCRGDYRPEVASALHSDVARLARATAHELAEVLTGMARAERFCSGVWLGFLVNGAFRPIFGRLAELREEAPV